MLTLLIATFNGAATLPHTLEALGRLASHGLWKLVIVDNGSTDATARIIRSHGAGLPLTYVFEPKPGQNAARNAGLRYAEGDLLVFTDDDVVPDPDWLAVLRATADEHPGYAMFTGRILPRWLVRPPAWVTGWVDHAVCYGATDPEQREGPVGANRICSSNMALRRTIFDAGFTFDEGVGPDGSRDYAMGSETDLTTRAQTAGFKAWYAERAMVHHLIREYQLERNWILQRAIRYGRGMCRRHLLRDHLAAPEMLWGYPRHLVLQIARHRARAALLRPFSEERWFAERWAANVLTGWARESKRFYTQPVHEPAVRSSALSRRH